MAGTSRRKTGENCIFACLFIFLFGIYHNHAKPERVAAGSAENFVFPWNMLVRLYALSVPLFSFYGHDFWFGAVTPDFYEIKKTVGDTDYDRIYHSSLFNDLRILPFYASRNSAAGNHHPQKCR
jgi:hypothetical protein